MKLSARKTKLVFETSSTVWSQGAERAVIVEASPMGGILRLAGTRQRLAFNWAAFYTHAARIESERAADAKTRAKKAAFAAFHEKEGHR